MDGRDSEQVVDPGNVGEKNRGDLRWGKVGEMKRVKRALNNHVVEAKAGDDFAQTQRGRRGGGLVVLLGAEGRVEVLDDSEFPVGVVGRNTEDLGSALMLAAEAERT